MTNSRTVRGYMLLEALIAVAIIGLVLPPLLLNSAERLHALKTMENELIAALVARNRVAQVRLANRLNGDRPARRSNGIESMAQREWYWRATSEPTEVPDYFRLEVVVGADKAIEDPLAEAVAFFSVEPSGGAD